MEYVILSDNLMGDLEWLWGVEDNKRHLKAPNVILKEDGKYIGIIYGNFTAVLWLTTLQKPGEP